MKKNALLLGIVSIVIAVAIAIFKMKNYFSKIDEDDESKELGI